MFLQGIRVQVRSAYIEGRSQPSKGQHFFAYRIRISNNSDRPVQLLRRHWIITDANGKSENVWWVRLFFFHAICYIFCISYFFICYSLILFFFLTKYFVCVFFMHHRGIGVIGEQPVILPQASFEYSSACPLSTPTGRMVRWAPSLFLCSSMKTHLKSIFYWFCKLIQSEKERKRSPNFLECGLCNCRLYAIS